VEYDERMNLTLVESGRGTFEIREWTDPTTGRTYIIEMAQMLYNWRLYLTPKDLPDFWEFGWCFRAGLHAAVAAAIWHPDTEDEPDGWHKRATYDNVRQAPNREEGAPIRCIHGRWARDMDCDVVPCPHWTPATLPAVDPTQEEL
jgi:hypothetical protein